MPLFISSCIRFSATVAKGHFPEDLLDQATHHWLPLCLTRGPQLSRRYDYSSDFSVDLMKYHDKATYKRICYESRKTDTDSRGLSFGVSRSYQDDPQRKGVLKGRN